MDTFSRSWDMIGESFAVLRKDKKLVLFPILSGLSTLAVAATYFVPLYRMGILEQYEAYRTVDPTVYAWLFLWYCTNYFVVIFFNCALAACAQIRFSGGEPTLGAGMSQAGWKIPSILMWAVAASTVVADGEKPDDEFDALPLDAIEFFPLPTRLNLGNAEFIGAWRSIYGYAQNIFDQRYYTSGGLTQPQEFMTGPAITNPQTFGPAKPVAIYGGVKITL